MRLVSLAFALPLALASAGCFLALDEDRLLSPESECPNNLLRDPVLDMGLAGWDANTIDFEWITPGRGGVGHAIEVCWDPAESSLRFREDNDLPTVTFPSVGTKYFLSGYMRTASGVQHPVEVTLQEDGPDGEIDTQTSKVIVNDDWQLGTSRHTIFSPSAELLELEFEADDPPADFCFQIDDICLRIDQ